MIVTLADSSLSDLHAVRIQLEALLYAHLSKHILLVPTRAQVSLIKSAGLLGPLAERTLAVIESRMIEYQALRGQAQRILRLVAPPEAPGSEMVGGCLVISLPIIDYCVQNAGGNTYLFVENGRTDRFVIEFLFEMTCKMRRTSSSYAYLRPMHGGGSTLGQVMMLMNRRDLVGLCICDRDRPGQVPPFSTGSTAQGAYRAAVELTILRRGEMGASSLQPNFAFMVTAGWTIENYIGPNVLDLFLQSKGAGNHLRPAFVRAFPNFPLLDEREVAAWLSLNFKSGTVIDDRWKEAVSRRFEIQAAQGACDWGGYLSVPGDLIEWAREQALGGQFSGKLKEAFAADMRSPRYAAEVYELVDAVSCWLAADARMAFA